MKVSVPVITPFVTMGNALFIQPTGFCKRNCPGCYTKNFGQDLSPFDFLNSLKIGAIKDFAFNQMTMALDELSEVMVERQIMKAAFHNYLEVAENKYYADEFHITVHTLEDLKDYSPNHERAIEVLDVISVSEIKFKDEAITLKDVGVKHLNWNLTIWNQIAADNYKKKMLEILPYVDSCYLILHKPDVGKTIHFSSWEAHQDMIKFVNTLPSELRTKVNIDGCVKDGERFNLTGLGCSSNISRFHLWPDNSVTGCPYNQKRMTPAADDFSKLRQNFLKVNKMYDFNTCKIPERLQPKSGFEFIILED